MPGVILWALLVLASIVLMVTGLWRSMFFGFITETGLVEDPRVGSLYLLGGSAASLAAAVWSLLRGRPHWGTACGGAPSVLVRGISLLMPYSLARHLVALVAIPGAFVGVIGGLMDGGYRRPPANRFISDARGEAGINSPATAFRPPRTVR